MPGRAKGKPVANAAAYLLRRGLVGHGLTRTSGSDGQKYARTHADCRRPGRGRWAEAARKPQTESKQIAASTGAGAVRSMCTIAPSVSTPAPLGTALAEQVRNDDGTGHSRRHLRNVVGRPALQGTASLPAVTSSSARACWRAAPPRRRRHCELLSCRAMAAPPSPPPARECRPK